MSDYRKPYRVTLPNGKETVLLMSEKYRDGHHPDAVLDTQESGVSSDHESPADEKAVNSPNNKAQVPQNMAVDPSNKSSGE